MANLKGRSGRPKSIWSDGVSRDDPIMKPGRNVLGLFSGIIVIVLVVFLILLLVTKGNLFLWRSEQPEPDHGSAAAYSLEQSSGSGDLDRTKTFPLKTKEQGSGNHKGTVTSSQPSGRTVQRAAKPDGGYGAEPKKRSNYTDTSRHRSLQTKQRNVSPPAIKESFWSDYNNQARSSKSSIKATKNNLPGSSEKNATVQESSRATSSAATKSIDYWSSINRLTKSVADESKDIDRILKDLDGGN